jgi:cobalamin biosynthesis Co2+ chelatase CbiK
MQNNNDIRTEPPFYNPEKVSLEALKLGKAVKDFIDAYDAEMKGILDKYKGKENEQPETEIRAAYLLHGQKQATLTNALFKAYVFFNIEMEQQERMKKVDEILKELKDKQSKG